ncbi:MAG: DUF4215 domain-containing protein, partial [Myxococcota bacterium]
MARAECGDGVLDAGEDCDLGIGNEVGSRCTTMCAEPQCGDGLRSPGESCDDGNPLGGDGCSADCRAEDEPRWRSVFGRAYEAEREWFSDVVSYDGGYVALGGATDGFLSLPSLLVAYDAEGNHRWTRSFGHEASGGLQALVVHNGQLLGVGTRTAPGDEGRGVFAAIGALGQVLGESLISGTGVVTRIAPGPDGDLFLAGLTEGFDAGRWVGRYRLQDDALLWTWTDP